MLDNKWFDNSDKKFMFMYYENDNTLHNYRVKVIGKEVKYVCLTNGVEKEEKSFKVDQDKVPNIAFRFYIIMMILAKDFDSCHLGRIQLVIDKGFEDEKKEAIEQEKMRSLEILAKEAIEKKEEQRNQGLKIMKELREEGVK